MPTHSYTHSTETEKAKGTMVTQHPACAKTYYVYCKGPIHFLVTGSSGQASALMLSSVTSAIPIYADCDSEKFRILGRTTLPYLQPSVTDLLTLLLLLLLDAFYYYYYRVPPFLSSFSSWEAAFTELIRFVK